MKEISAGGVVFRRIMDKLEILLIEDRYCRWTLPKGKQESGETIEITAMREVLEETGLSVQIVELLHTIHYRYRHNLHGSIDKTVTYFLMETTGGTKTAQLEEINGVRWFTPEEAWAMLQTKGYENNHAVVQMAYQRLGLEKETE